MFKTSIGRFRVVSYVEGISFLLLLFVAMPLKYWAGIPTATKIVGMAHGLLFVLYVIILMDTASDSKWHWKRTALYFIAASIPFATFWTERQLRQETQPQTQPAIS